MANKCVLFITSQNSISEELIDKIFKPLYNSLNDEYDLFILYNKEYNNDENLDIAKYGINTDVYNFSNEYLKQIYKQLNFKRMGYNAFNIVYEFYKLHNDYDYYWVLEDDVVFTGEYLDLFNYYNDNNSDLLCTSFTHTIEHPYTDIDVFNSIHDNTISGGDFEITDDNYALAFLPIARCSNKLLKTIIEGPLYLGTFQEHQVGITCKINNLKYNVMTKVISIKYANGMHTGSVAIQWVADTEWNNKPHILDIYFNTRNLLIHPIKKQLYDKVIYKYK